MSSKNIRVDEFGNMALSWSPMRHLGAAHAAETPFLPLRRAGVADQSDPGDSAGSAKPSVRAMVEQFARDHGLKVAAVTAAVAIIALVAFGVAQNAARRYVARNGFGSGVTRRLLKLLCEIPSLAFRPGSAKVVVFDDGQCKIVGAQQLADFIQSGEFGLSLPSPIDFVQARTKRSQIQLRLEAGEGPLWYGLSYLDTSGAPWRLVLDKLDDKSGGADVLTLAYDTRQRFAEDSFVLKEGKWMIT